MRKTFLTICAAVSALFAVSSCYDDAPLWGEIERLDGRIDKLEQDLNADIANLNALQGKVTDLETSLKKLITDGDAAVKAALEKALNDAVAKVKADLEKAIADGDTALQAALEAEKAKIETALANLQDGLDGVAGDLDAVEGDVATLKDDVAALQTAIATLEETLGVKYQELLGKIDAADGVLDGKIADLTAALDAVKKAYAEADTELKETISEEMALAIAEALLDVTVQNVEEVEGVIVLTLADGTTVKLSKPLENVDNEGLVTVVEVEGAKYWAVVVDGEPVSLDILVGAPVKLLFQVAEDGALQYSINDSEWVSTGAYVADSTSNLFNGFYQGETGEYVYDENWEMVPVLEDFYTLEFGGHEYFLPMYKVDNSVVTLKSGKTYFTFGETKTIDIAVTDVTAMYVMTKPDGWRANLDGNKLTVTAPAEANVTSGVAEADGEVLLHCTTVEGTCKIAKLNVATTEGFSLTVDLEGNVEIINPVVVTTTNMWGEENTDFNDAYVGLAEVAAFEADPVSYVENIQDNWDALFYYLNNWKMNTAETDEDWNMTYTIGGAYEPGVYEVDKINTTVAKMYSDWKYGAEMPRGSQFVVWACPMDDKGMPKTDELVYGYYTPIDVAAELVDSSFNEVTVSVALYGAKEYIVGKIAKEYTLNYNTMEYDLNYYLSDGLNGLAYGYNNLGMTVAESGEFEYALSEVVNDMEEPVSLSPATEYYFYIIPVIDGKEWSEYTPADAFAYEFKTAPLAEGGSATVEFSNEVLGYTDIAVDITGSEGTSMIYYNFYDQDVVNEFSEEDLLADLMGQESFVTSGDFATARDNNLEQGQSRVLAAIAVDSLGQYGDVVKEVFTTSVLTYSETFKATVGEPVLEANGSNWSVTIPVTVEGGTAAKYYYYWNSNARTEEQLNTLPLQDYYYYLDTVELPTLTFYNYYASYQFAVVVESEDGEYSAPVIVTVAKPAAEETPAE